MKVAVCQPPDVASVFCDMCPMVKMHYDTLNRFHAFIIMKINIMLKALSNPDITDGSPGK